MEGNAKQQILEEATRRFAAHGFDGTSIKDIADAVGIRKPSLLYHFATKEELRREVLEQALSRWNDVLPRVLMAAAQNERLDAVMHELISFFAEDPDRARLLVREVLDRPDDMRERLRTHVRPWIEVFARQLGKARERGHVHADVDPEAYSALMVAMVVGGMAMVGTAEVILPTGDESRAAQDRLLREMLRIARSSSYLTQASTNAAGEPPARAPRG